MAERCQKAQNSVSLQSAVFSAAKRDYGLSVKALSAKTGIPATTLSGWEDGAVMPLWAFFQLGSTGELGGGIPAHLMNLLGESFGLAVVPAEIENDLDKLAQQASIFVSAWMQARNARGGAITSQENANLIDLAKQLAGAARVAA